MESKLYHYCSIGTLELILKTGKIRFSSLGTVDDMEESLTAEDLNLGKVCFVSCWTDLEDDTVDMWKNYTAFGKGVRIGLPKDFFVENLISDNTLDIYHDINKEYDVSLSPPYVPTLSPVTYTKDESLIKLSVLSRKKEDCDNCGKKGISLVFETKLLGKFKRDSWRHQSEWRYILINLPNQIFQNNSDGRYLNNDLEVSISLMESDYRDLEFSSNVIDYKFSKSVFDNLEILTSPLNSEKENQEIAEIIKKYALKKQIEIRRSRLPIRK